MRAPHSGRDAAWVTHPERARQNHRQPPDEGFTNGRPAAQAAALGRHCERSTDMSTITTQDPGPAGQVCRPALASEG